MESSAQGEDLVLWLAEWCGVPPEKLSPETTLLGDLGVDGDDGIELLEAFADRFLVDMSNCAPARHFGPEGLPLWAPFNWIALAFRRGAAEQRSGLEAITVGRLLEASKRNEWGLSA